MSDRTRIAAYWREQTIHEYSAAERAAIHADLHPNRPALEVLRQTDPIEAARRTREARAGTR